MKIKGNYDDEAEALLRSLPAESVSIIVIGGPKGHGFSVAGYDKLIDPDSVCARLPEILRRMADSIEADIKARKLQ